MPPTDPVALTQELIRCQSITPVEGGALDLLQGILEPLGFVCHRLVFDEQPGETPPVPNLYARLGTEAPHFCFAGHTDVVPPGDVSEWSHDPFAAEIEDGILYGRGAADMKGGVAAFVAALARYLKQNGPPKGSISLLITGDEEGPAINGTQAVLRWLEARGETIDACIVGEPSNLEKIGDMIKIGRRGSVCFDLTVKGTQGHVAYPERADNPIPKLVKLVAAVMDEPVDEGSANFQPSSLQFTTIDVGNPATNVIPSQATARCNIRFNDLHSGESLEHMMRARLDAVGIAYEMKTTVYGESFLTAPKGFVEDLAEVVEAETGHRPQLDTGGGTSDARFISRYAPVAEFGLVSRTIHKTNECTTIEDLESVCRIYQAVLSRFFA